MNVCMCECVCVGAEAEARQSLWNVLPGWLTARSHNTSPKLRAQTRNPAASTAAPKYCHKHTQSPTHTHIEIVPRLSLSPPRAHTLLSICDNGSFISKYQRLYLRPSLPRPPSPLRPRQRIVCSLANIFVWCSNWHFQCGTKSVPSEVEMIQTVIKSASTWTLQQTLHWTLAGCER